MIWNDGFGRHEKELSDKVRAALFLFCGGYALGGDWHCLRMAIGRVFLQFVRTARAAASPRGGPLSVRKCSRRGLRRLLPDSKLRHATERKRGLASRTGGCRLGFQSFFVLTNKKCGMAWWFSMCRTLFADGGVNATAVRRGGAAANCAAQRTAGVTPVL